MILSLPNLDGLNAKYVTNGSTIFVKMFVMKQVFVDRAKSNCVTFTFGHYQLGIIAELKNTKSTGLFDLPVDIIKCSALNIAFPLTHLINQSLATGIVPLSMNAAIITHIFKSGDVYEIMNYRPI